MLITVLALAAITLVLKGAAALAPALPTRLVERTGNLAPALLAALVVTEVAGPDGIPQADAKSAAVGVAVLLAWRRAPLGICVIAGAVVAALLRLA